jgi:DNA-binding CsgD family transcriptional regulator
VEETAALDGMPDPWTLRLTDSGGASAVAFGPRVLFCYDSGDTGMRNLAVVALTDAGVPGKDAAALFGLSPVYVSMLRGRARAEGAAGLARRRGRPPKLTPRQARQARVWAGQGMSQTETARRLKVARSVISELLGRLGPIPTQPELGEPAEPGRPEEPADVDDVAGSPAADNAEDAEDADGEGCLAETGEAPACADAADAPAAAGPVTWPAARLGEGVFWSRHAGAMLAHAFTDRVGATAVLAGAAGPAGRARFDDVGLLAATSMAFTLGAKTVEQVKHLTAAEAGPLCGLARLPGLRTLRPRLAGVADACDPLGLQRAFAKAMLDAEPCESGVYFVDDHFVPYAGAKPVPKGWNTKRRAAQRGRADTWVTDHAGRAVAFTTGEPSGLTKTLPPALAQLRAIVGPHAKIMLGFDRGGSYPQVFAACRDAGADWITYRRAPLAAPTRLPVLTTIVRDGKARRIAWSEETVDIDGYGPARQITLFERGEPVLQVLTSDTRACPAKLLAYIKARWRIENAFKYADHHGIDALCDYIADIEANTRPVDNPARKTANTAHKAAKAALGEAERALAHILADPAQTPAQKNRRIPAAQKKIDQAKRAVAEAETARKAIPATLPANQIDPTAERALLRTRRRALQMVLRLLAYNAEHWLANHLNAYLQDDDEYRAITRETLIRGLAGAITYTPEKITVTLDRPTAPRIARALTLLTEEINNTPPRLPGDPRPITYTIKP